LYGVLVFDRKGEEVGDSGGEFIGGGGQRIWGCDIALGCRQHTVYTVPAQYSTIPRPHNPWPSIPPPILALSREVGCKCIIRVIFSEAMDRHTGHRALSNHLCCELQHHIIVNSVDIVIFNFFKEPHVVLATTHQLTPCGMQHSSLDPLFFSNNSYVIMSITTTSRHFNLTVRVLSLILVTTIIFFYYVPDSTPYPMIRLIRTNLPSSPISRLTSLTNYFNPWRMSSFTLPSSTIQVNLTPDLTREQLLGFRPFSSWLSKLQHSLSLQSSSPGHPFHGEEYSLKSITIQSVDFFGYGDKKRIGFIKILTSVKNPKGESIPGSVFLRGGSVTILLIIEPEGAKNERWAVLTVQPRIPAGSLEMVELPAGMIDDAGTFAGAAANEIEEECGIKIPQDKLIDLTSLALKDFTSAERERLEEAIYPSPGGSDEFMKIFAHVYKIPKDTLRDWQGRLTGLRDHGEKITLKLVKLEDLWKETRDAKALSAIALWDGLKREGRI